MVKVGQIYKEEDEIFVITYANDDGLGVNTISPDGDVGLCRNEYIIEDFELIAEYSTWLEAVNSPEFINAPKYQSSVAKRKELCMKSKKMRLYDIMQLDTRYYYFDDIEYEGVKGTVYHFMQLTEKDILKIKSFGNTHITEYENQYAPGIKGQAVFLADKCFNF